MSIFEFICYMTLIVVGFHSLVGVAVVFGITYYRCSVIDMLGHKIRYEINVRQVKSKK